MITIRPTIKSIPKGSYGGRLNEAQRLNSEFFKLANLKTRNGKLSYNDCKTILYTLLPKNTIIHINKLTKSLSSTGALGAMAVNKNDKKVSYNLYLPLIKHSDKKNNDELLINQKDFNVLAHENFHLFAGFTNPKHVARDNFDKKDYKIYSKLFYCQMLYGFDRFEKFIWSIKVKDAIKHKTTSEKLDFLQNCRYRMLEEYFAYKEENKFKKRDVKDYYFKEKIKETEHMIYKLIKRKRKSQKINMKKTKGCK